MKLLLATVPRFRQQGGPHAGAGFILPPLGLASVAASLRTRGHEVKILDASVLGLDEAAFVESVRRARPDVLGMTALSPTKDLVARALALARPLVPRLLVGGPHPSALRDGVFADLPGVDAAIEGEAEHSALEAAEWFAAGERGEPPPGLRVPGRSFRAAPRPDLHGLARPAWDLLPRSLYRYPLATRPGLATMVTSRGCPRACRFCDRSVSGESWRAVAPHDVVEEMAWHEAEGAGFLCFFDDDFALDPARAAAVCEEILRRDLGLAWKCELRPERARADLFPLMARAGCRIVAMGAESPHPRSRAFLGRSGDFAEVRVAFTEARRAGLQTLAYVILGVPGEGEAEVRETIRAVEGLRPDWVQYATLAVYPGASLAEDATPCVDVRGPLDAEARRPTLTDLEPEALSRLLAGAWARFYLRPGPLFRVASHAWRARAHREALAALLSLGRRLGRLTR